MQMLDAVRLFDKKASSGEVPEEGDEGGPFVAIRMFRTKKVPIQGQLLDPGVEFPHCIDQAPALHDIRHDSVLEHHPTTRMFLGRCSARHVRPQLRTTKLARSQERLQHLGFFARERIHHFLGTIFGASDAEASLASIGRSRSPRTAACESSLCNRADRSRPHDIGRRRTQAKPWAQECKPASCENIRFPFTEAADRLRSPAVCL